ncbi:lysylphosphatidylglycerol synthase domain-containing protein [Luteimonas changyuni]|uniref:lysylphosphatidylglycerol synthase domain-containing protein n=1 Tax=Luteimonas sp. MJ145 TaxID=3129234 RepID=UPI0031BBB7BE
MKKGLKAAGIVLAIAALAYFGRHAWRTLEGQDLSVLTEGPGLAGMLLLVLLYTASLATTSAAWLWQLRALGQPASYAWTTSVLAVTQFGKYLPGNVGQHIGRVGLAVGAGVRLSAALLTLGYELLIAIVAAAHLGAAAVLLWPPAAFAGASWLNYRWPLLVTVTLGALAGLLLAPRLVVLLLRMRSPASPAVEASSFRLDLRAIAGSYVMYLSSLLAIGLGLWVLALALLPGDVAMPTPLFFVGAFAVSWIAGFVVPGAPAGLGVRELVLTAWLGDALPATTVVVLVLALRVATTIGDAINFGWGSWALARRRTDPMRERG